MTPRGIRNNNPGNIELGDPWQGLSGQQTDGRFAQFNSPEYGIRAMGRVLNTYQTKHGLKTPREIIARWAPAGENNVGAYVNSVARHSGLDPDQPVNLSRDGGRLVAAMIQHENGQQPYSEEVISRGLQMAGFSGGAGSDVVAGDAGNDALSAAKQELERRRTLEAAKKELERRKASAGQQAAPAGQQEDPFFGLGPPPDGGEEYDKYIRELRKRRAAAFDPGPLPGLLNVYGNGLMGGFSDNVAGALNLVFDQALDALGLSPDSPEAKTARQSYNEGVKRQRDRIATARSENPNLATVAEAAGAVTTGAGLASVGATLLRGGGLTAANVGRGAAEGAAYGAVYGAGNADGEDVAGAALEGAGVGAAFGAITPVAFAALSQIPVGARTLANLFGVGKADRKAAALVSKALAEDGPLSMAVKDMPDTLMDLSGPSTRRLAGAARAVPSAGSSALEEMLENRVQTQGSRIAKETLEFLGSAGDDFYQSVQDLIEKRAAKAKPIYAALNKKSMPLTNELAKLMERPSMQAAVQRAAKSVEDMTGQAVDLEAGQLSFTLADQIKKQLDKMARYGKTPQGAADGFDVAAVRSLTKQYLKVVDKHFSGYARARALYQGDAQLLDAMELGQKFIRGDADEMAAQFAKLPQAEKEAFRLGAASALRREVDRLADTRDAAAKLWNNPQMRSRLKAIAPSGSAFGNYLQRLKRESTYARTRGEVVRGSPTQPRQVAADEAARTVFDFMSGGIQQVMAVLRFIGARADGLDQATASKISDLLAGDPQDALRFIRSQEGTWLVQQNANQLLPLIERSTLRGVAGQAGAETGALRAPQ